jgi:hypothetical protein
MANEDVVAATLRSVMRGEGSIDRVVLGVDVRLVEKRRLLRAGECASSVRVKVGSLAR